MEWHKNGIRENSERYCRNWSKDYVTFYLSLQGLNHVCYTDFQHHLKGVQDEE